MLHTQEEPHAQVILDYSFTCMRSVDIALRVNCEGSRFRGRIEYWFCPVYKELFARTLNARWMYGSAYSGPGIATGGPKEGFAGRYHVRYFYDNGKFSDEYDLVIERIGDSYKASWITKGEIAAVGVGMEVENGLAIGWRKVAD